MIAVIITTVISLVKTKKKYFTLYSYLNIFFYLLAILIILGF